MSRAIGKRVPRLEGERKVSGREIYTFDVWLPGTLVGLILRSPHAFARIRKIDTRAAAAAPGVMAVITAHDFTTARYVNYGAEFSDRYALARDYVRFIGEEVAAVAAETEAQAKAALELIDVDYELLDPLLTPEAALIPGARKIHPDDGRASNVAMHVDVTLGDVEEAFAGAHLVVEDQFEHGVVWPVCLETNGAVADYNAESGILQVWAATQAPYFVKKELSTVIGIPAESIHVRSTAVGGGFGGKGQSPEPIAIAAKLAHIAKKPVKIALSRTEEYLSGKTDHAKNMLLATAVDEFGNILARRMRAVIDNGAYSHMGPVYASILRQRVACLYKVAACSIDAKLVYTNKVPGGAYRGMGAPQVIWALETQIDEVAEKLDLDPLDYRLRIANEPGDRTLLNWNITSCGMRESLHEAAQLIGWRDKRSNPRPWHGVGIAAMIHASGSVLYAEGNFSIISLELTQGGRLLVATQTADTGTGQNTVLAQFVAEAMSVDVMSIDVLHMDTERAPPDLGSAASRVTFVTGHAAIAAAKNLVSALLEKVADLYGFDVRDLTYDAGVVLDKRSRMRPVGLGDAYQLLGTVKVEGRYSIEIPRPDAKTGVGNYAAAYVFGAQAAEVEVDPSTGHVRVLNVAAAQDVGRVVNPLTLEGQIEGGILQGIGMALSEEVVFEGGRPVNTSLFNYRVPRFCGTPNIQMKFIETNDKAGPFGAKAAGEPSINATVAAIANAVAHATGIRFRRLPITPERVLAALENRRTPVRTSPFSRVRNVEVAAVRKVYPSIFPLMRTVGPALSRPRPRRANFNVVTPATVQEATAALSSNGGYAKVLGGGTDLLPGIRQGIYAPERLVDISMLPGVRSVTASAAGLRIGSAVTLTGMQEDELVQLQFPGLSEGILLLATPQIRNTATIAGDLCQEKRCWFFRTSTPCYRYQGSACPCYAVLNDNRHHAILNAGRCAAPCVSDLAPMLSALDASVSVVGPSGSRQIAIEHLYRWAGEPKLLPHEFIDAVDIPAATGGVFVYEKYARWMGDFAEASAAVSLMGTETAPTIRISLGGIAPSPVRCRAAEVLLASDGLTNASIRRAAELTVKAVLPFPGNRYKVRLAINVVERALRRTQARLRLADAGALR